MSHALLLRLFLSPYFSISVAMHYLKTYPDSIGISHYLCWRMKSMPAEEVEFYWPQTCHLLLTYPTPSNALEAFILARAEESTHSAMLTFWFMQAALRDLTPARATNPRPFLICQRILHRCHEIIFGDPPEPSRSPYRSLPHSPPNSAAALHASNTMHSLRMTPPNAMLSSSNGEGCTRRPIRVNSHIPPALVGMGVVMAGASGMPGLKDLAGQWAVIQGRRARDEDRESRARVEVDRTGGAAVVHSQSMGGRKASNESKDSGGSDEDEILTTTNKHQTPPSTAPARTPSFNISHASSTTPNLTSPQVFGPEFSPHLYSSTSPSSSPRQKGDDPFSQDPPSSPPVPSRTSTPPPQPTRHPFYSVPEFSTSQGGHHTSALRRLHPTDRPPPADALLATYSPEAQRQLLRGHYCRSQIRFLLLLEDISNRLLVIPKPARVSALRAELTSLNHNLPAEVCMPLWCAADHSHEEGGQTSSAGATPLKSRPQSSYKKGHSRVVRISPGDSVVLNSAERAPFLLHVEILEGDLDFDPTKRENRELLKKIVVQEDMKRRKKEGVYVDLGSQPRTEGFGSPMPNAVPPTPKREGATKETRSPQLHRSPPTQRKQARPEDMEEMDLVEQLYGAKLSVKDVLPDMSETIPLPNAPRNKALDVAAWDRGTDGPSRRPSFSPNGTPRSATFNMEPPSATARLFPSSAQPDTPGGSQPATPGLTSPVDMQQSRVITLEDYSERMRTAAVMLAQLNASQISTVPENQSSSSGGALSWIPGTGWIMGTSKDGAGQGNHGTNDGSSGAAGGKLRLAAAQAAAIRERIMEEMMALEDERVNRMTHRPEGVEIEEQGRGEGQAQTAEDEGIVRRELNKADPSAVVFKESWTAKKTRIRASSPWGHLANWDVISVIVKTGTDLRQEQLATQLIERFSRIFKEEKCDCWVRFFRILITGESSGLVETITDAVSVHSIKKGEYARRIAEGGQIGSVSLMDHFVNTYGKPDSGRLARAQRNFIKSLAGYSIVTYLLQIKDRHNGNILVDRDGHLIHIDFGFMLSNSPGGNMGFEAAPFKMPLDYVDIMGGLDSPGYAYFKRLFKEGFEAARKHSDSLITIVELMQKDSKLYCFALFGTETTKHFRDRFALGLTTSAVDAYLERLIVSSTGSNYTRLYDTFQYYSQGVL